MIKYLMIAVILAASPISAAPRTPLSEKMTALKKVSDDFVARGAVAKTPLTVVGLYFSVEKEHQIAVMVMKDSVQSFCLLFGWNEAEKQWQLLSSYFTVDGTVPQPP